MLLLILIPVWGCVSAKDDTHTWRTPELSNQVYMQTQEGLVIIELAPFIAPKHVERFMALVDEGFYDGLDFYRVIDGFVAQGGDILESRETEHSSPLMAEFTRPTPEKNDFMVMEPAAFKAPQTGYLYGFSAGQDPQSKEQWLLHCPGTLALARNNDANSATTDFYIVIGQAPRHLDRNMSSFGRVIYGMPVIQRLARAKINNASGVIELPSKRSVIEWAKPATKIAEKDRINVQVEYAHSEQVQQRLEAARTLSNEFFHYRGNQKLDLCYHQLKTRVI